MTRFIGIIVLIGALCMMLMAIFPIGFYLQPRTDRLQQLWTKDLKQLSAKKPLMNLLPQMGNYEISFSDPQVATELDALEIPLKTTASGSLAVSVEVIRWIEGHRYGYILQHDIFDLSTGEPEKIYEFSRNYSIGFYW